MGWGVVNLCWFVVPVCCGFRVGVVSKTAISRVFGQDRWPSASEVLSLAGEVILLTCFK